MLMSFLCFRARDIVVMQSRGFYFLLCSLIVQFDAVAGTSFFKYRVSSMNLYLLVRERRKETVD